LAKAGTTTTITIKAVPARGFKWWELDVSYYGIRALGLVGLVWDIREPTEKALATKRI